MRGIVSVAGVMKAISNSSEMALAARTGIFLAVRHGRREGADHQYVFADNARTVETGKILHVGWTGWHSRLRGAGAKENQKTNGSKQFKHSSVLELRVTYEVWIKKGSVR